MKWTRRGLIGATFALLGYLVLRDLTSTFLTKHVDSDAEESFLELFREVVRALDLNPEVGEIYLNSAVSRAREANFRTLAQLIHKRVGSPAPQALGWSWVMLHPHRAQLIEMLAKAIKQDFSEGNISLLQNWYLSVTECRLAAAKYILHQEDQNLPPLARVSEFTPGVLQKVKRWGPQLTRSGQPFNVQSNGTCLFRIETKDKAQQLTVFLSEMPLSTRVESDVITASLGPKEVNGIIARPGYYGVFLVSLTERIKQELGQFRVLDYVRVSSLPSVRLREIVDWGPQSVRKGQVLKLESDQSLRFWIRTTPGPKDVTLFLGNTELPTEIGANLITAILKPGLASIALNTSGTYEVFLASIPRRLKQKIGDLTVSDE